MIRSYYDIWERLANKNPQVLVNITTNATILSKRAKSILEKLRCHVIVSLDSMKRENYERIRRNAAFEDVMENLRYLMAYSERAGVGMSLAVCPMPQNWKEVPEILQFCNRNHLSLGINTVYWPVNCSLKSLNTEELSEIVAYWSEYRLDDPYDALTETNIDRFRAIINQVAEWRDISLNYRRERSRFDEDQPREDATLPSSISELIVYQFELREVKPTREVVQRVDAVANKIQRIMQAMASSGSVLQEVAIGLKKVSSMMHDVPSDHLDVIQKVEFLLPILFGNSSEDDDLKDLLNDPGEFVHWLTGQSPETILESGPDRKSQSD